MTAIAYAALWIFVFAVPWENILVIPGIGTISRLTGMAALGLAVLAVVITGRVRRPQPFHLAALLFVIWAGLGAFRTADQARGFGKFATYFQLLLVLWMIWELAPSFKRQRALMLAYVCGAYVAAVNTIVVYRTVTGTPSPLGGGGSRFAAQGFDPNDLGMTLALGLPMAWYLGMTYPRPLMRWLCRGYIPVGLVAIGLTGSRGALVASIVALTVIPLSMTQLSPAKIVAAVFLLFASGAAAVAYIPQTSWDRFATTRTEVASGTLNSRLRIWKDALQAFSHKPVIGYGTSGFNWAVRSQSHNAYLGVLVEQGIIGFMMFAAMFVAVFLKILRMPPMERRFALVLMATVGVAMLPLGWDDRKPVWVILALLTALGAALEARRVGLHPMLPHVSRRPIPIPRSRAAS